MADWEKKPSRKTKWRLRVRIQNGDLGLEIQNGDLGLEIQDGDLGLESKMAA